MQGTYKSCSKRTVNNKMKLITIGGIIIYKSSKNYLVRKSYGVKKKKNNE